MITGNTRTILSVPGHIKKMHEKAFLSNADVIQFDLEDSVPFSEKANARTAVLETLEKSWENNTHGKIIAIRLCAPESPFFGETIFWFFENRVYEHVDVVCMPKVENACDVQLFDKFIRKTDGVHRNFNLNLALCIESAIGIENLNEIATSCDYITALVFGIADYTQSLGMSLTSISGHGENDDSIYGYRFTYAMSRIVNCAKAHGLLAIDSPYGDFNDMDGLRKSAEKARFFGMDGKWVIHPNQIDVVNEVFSPSESELQNATKIVELFESAAKYKQGAIAFEGKMIDIATYNLATKILKTNRS